MLNRLLNTFTYNERDSSETKFSKKLILIIALICSICGVFWSILYYFVLGTIITSILILSFPALISLSILIAHFRRNYKILVYTQLVLIAIIPAIVQWSIGSIHDSGLVFLWCFLSPIGALLFLPKKETQILHFIFLCTVVIFAFWEPDFYRDKLGTPNYGIIIFYIMNIGFPSTITFIIMSYFLTNLFKQKEKNDGLIVVLQEKQTQILDSINYAKRIQSAILPPIKLIKKELNEAFVFYKPKNVVSGDFYWLKHIDNSVYFAVGDCTGHGVPGALVSIICNAALNQSVGEFKLTDPADILDKTRDLLSEEFAKSEEKISDGMDIAICKLDGRTISYAGANNPLWIIRNKKIIVINGDKEPIGKWGKETPFTTHHIELKSEDSIYILSDGFADQFGGSKEKKYKSGRLKIFLTSIQDYSMDQQHEMLEKEFKSWKGDLEQIDDVSVIGVKIK